ncbi:MAG: glutathione S-transferase family protein [Acidihalobacter sp.]|uniref:glutathione S-transferase family protein n=1 Tax=Acidihalobacter sp. TaxID=1872108 RepID=UPI00307D2B1A
MGSLTANTEDTTLVIGNRNYSSWSLRAWLFMRQNQVPFTELRVALGHQDTADKLREYSASGLVPVLLESDLHLWDSLAICEYVSECHLDGRGWPADQRARAVARAACAEMHSGFPCLRQHLPMNLRSEFAWRDFSDKVGNEISRITSLWSECRHAFAHGKPWLFGDFSIADAFFAPIATRFLTYNVPMPADAARYVEELRALPALDAWYTAARNEIENLPQYEALEIWLA